MKHILLLFFLFILFYNTIFPGINEKKEIFLKDDITAVMKKVCDWQLGQPRRYRNNDWTRATFFTGVMATYHTTNDEKYHNAALEWAEENRWELFDGGISGRDRGNEHCAGQTYLELFFIQKDSIRIASIKNAFDYIISNPKPGNEEWWWCDALFMSPPTMARLSAAAGEQKYLDFMNTLWWENNEMLYDTEEHLYYRDSTFKINEDGSGPRTRNGKKVFWGRGNGWAAAGLVRVLQSMPTDYPERWKYINLLKEMSEKLASLQQIDGLWRTSLLDPDEYPAPETSCSGFFCYALAWGLNQGILEEDKYLPVAADAWKGLVRCVDESGKLGWVQKVGSYPEAVSRDDTEVYGAGAFLLAGSEIAKIDEELLHNIDIPDKFYVNKPYPNPFNPITTIRYGIPEDCRVRLAIYDILGREIAVLRDGITSAGVHEAFWDGRNDRGLSVGSGVYFYRFKAGNFTEHGKITFLK